MATKSFSVEFLGFKELEKMLSQLPTEGMKKATVRKTLKAALKPTAKEIENNIPEGPTGKLKNSIKISSGLKGSQKQHEDTDGIYMYVGSTAPQAHLIELGTVERFKKSGASTGFITPNPFMRKAWAVTDIKALKIFSDLIGKNLLKSARLLIKKATKGTLTKKQLAGFSR
jgi:HK97 gp10 family phage protein